MSELSIEALDKPLRDKLMQAHRRDTAVRADYAPPLRNLSRVVGAIPRGVKRVPTYAGRFWSAYFISAAAVIGYTIYRGYADRILQAVWP